ncbi:MAG: 2,3-dehydroadipyl-CoA hydratase [Rhodospirillaceae bacterium]|jgi:enoyl-CoA hydratase|nr:2,3-dehydroadipyl-CoA hydratase [Rhodospirillaceae bacterium]MBT5245350.1 2,3-dehydroadipyl-CoA hydratase [Rhodospirillaceae bacterium]MBT5562322.1 2,3-dehydroadipyl-CoA hydratase [Rhodospirillaceae bacterium]MBT6242687.1 2,3-dehydroadipyl-CoA hydratase [Rhodospirillaceae bacterium]MBT7138262.1 2,3-dehydroadipyl-CoA hydratase [Rhodospirillaceae bacterium]
MSILIIDERPDDAIAVLTLNRPEVHNALNTAVLEALAQALERLSAKDDINAVVLSGGEKVFAAGADVKEMADLDAIGIHRDARSGHWRAIAAFPKPLIAAVNGYALGGGCELAMQSDIIIAGETAQFGLPEINLGLIPGAGGTQRLTRAVGKSLAMKMILSGEFIDAVQALEAELVAEVTPAGETIARACALACKIAEKSPLALEMAKQSVLKTFETSLANGLDFERRSFTILAASEDRKEGIAAFLEKRKPAFKGR